jgi:hypothetical protein
MFKLNVNLSEIEKIYGTPEKYYWNIQYSYDLRSIYTLGPLNDNRNGITMRVPINDEEADIVRLLLKIYEEQIIINSVHGF